MKKFYLMLLALLFVLLIHAQDDAVITPENAHLITLEYMVIPTGPRLDTVIHAPAADLVAMTSVVDPGIYICQTDQTYIDDPANDEPHFASRLFRGCQNIGLAPEAIFPRVTLPAWSPDGSRLAFSLLEGIGIIDVPDEGFGEGIALDVLPLLPPEGTLYSYSVRGYTNTMSTSERIITALHWSPDGTMVYAIDTEDVIYVWDGVTGELLREIPAPDAIGYIWSPDGTQLIGWDETHITVLTFDGQTLRQTHTRQRGDFGMPSSAALTPDGTRVAFWNIRGVTGEVQLYDLTDSAPPQNLTVTETWLSAVAWLPDGALLATGDFAGKLRLWDAQTGGLLHEIYINPNPVSAAYIYDLTWSTDGTRIVTVSHDEAVRTWAIPTE